QDVPRAIKLLRAIISLADIQPPPNDLQAAADLDAIRLLSALFKFLLDAFTDTSFSLSQQVSSLSAFAHLAFSLFRQHRRQFSPYPLYYDYQSMVKNFIFCIIKQSLLDPSRSIWIGDTGDDKLEGLFAYLRMLGSHDLAMSLVQLESRLGAACDIKSTFDSHPELVAGARRLQFGRIEASDHLRRRHWTGDLTPASCNLPASWHHGRSRAAAILSISQVPFRFYD
ncbi:hypothetical protein CONPUDRAFT_61594, partial [Coniophora puteana RWD-64-598 SS2]